MRLVFISQVIAFFIVILLSIVIDVCFFEHDFNDILEIAAHRDIREGAKKLIVYFFRNLT